MSASDETNCDLSILNKITNYFNTDNDNEENPFAIGNWIEGDSLAPPCQAELDVVESILKLSNPNANSILYDLGCGDGRICLFASCLYGCRSIGCEIEENLIDKFNIKIEQLNLKEKVTAVHEDLLQLDLSNATIITLYLLPEAIELLKPKLIAYLNRGDTVLVCNTWGPKGLTPIQTVHCGYNNNVTLHKYDSSSII